MPGFETWCWCLVSQVLCGLFLLVWGQFWRGAGGGINTPALFSRSRGREGKGLSRQILASSQEKETAFVGKGRCSRIERELCRGCPSVSMGPLLAGLHAGHGGAEQVGSGEGGGGTEGHGLGRWRPMEIEHPSRARDWDCGTQTGPLPAAGRPGHTWNSVGTDGMPGSTQ